MKILTYIKVEFGVKTLVACHANKILDALMDNIMLIQICFLCKCLCTILKIALVWSLLRMGS